MPRFHTTPEQRAWMVERLPYCGSIEYALDLFEQEFGHRMTKNAVYQWAHKAGVHMGSELPKERDTLCTRRILWKQEPELMEWMLEHDKGQPVANLRAEFKEAQGFDITRAQIGIFRQAHGNVTKKATHDNGRSVPLGTRRKTKGGWLVKVREKANVPGTKDNWELEHRMVWEKHHGEVPKGSQLVFLDGNCDNCDISNLFCIEKRLIAQVNAIGWHDKESLEFAIAKATLKTAVKDAYMREKTCMVCGSKFMPWDRERSSVACTCRACLDAGRKSKGVPTPKGEAECVVCGARFTKYMKTQRRCRACIDAKPKHAPAQHAMQQRRANGRSEPS